MDRLIESRNGLPDIFEPDLYSGRVKQILSINMMLASGCNMEELLASDSPAAKYARRRMEACPSFTGIESDHINDESEYHVVSDTEYSESYEMLPLLTDFDRKQIAKEQQLEQTASQLTSSASTVASKSSARTRARRGYSSASSTTTVVSGRTSKRLSRKSSFEKLQKLVKSLFSTKQKN
ncbi:hypothetical protein GGI25_000289 [Coemansia spiralis]|uniref:Uncharacterized protein n=2 Tax=Coemansia TaxID=4863 RepID=A0A9W8GES3_9FUNG|nr:hypothetical protein EDC05_000493 [Coemansia umbellata]KAJ2625861.1 hypothetical protein GGI26_000324 [Coemansia sp. RSA 1358]KAJ2680983.1 hypothetical protein GGI25_000289 [Coemansia spiralis]